MTDTRATDQDFDHTEMVRGVSAQTATVLTVKELLLGKGVVSQGEWDECFAKNHRNEMERMSAVMNERTRQ